MRLLKGLAFAAVVVVALLVGGVLVLRYLQGTFDAPRDIAGADRVTAITGFGTEIYAAKVGDDDVILFDTGVDVEARAVDRLLAAVGMSRKITHAFVTHGHFDHSWGIEALQKRGTVVHAGAADLPLIDMSRPIKSPVAKVMVAALKPAPAKPDDLLEGRREIDVGDGEKVVAIPLPGHTPGTYLYFHRGVLYTGDAILFENARLTSGMEIFNEDTKQNRASIAALDLSGLDVKIVCTGHTGCTPPDSGNDLLAALQEDCATNP